MIVRILVPVLAAAALCGSTALAADSNRCLHFRDLGSFSKVDDTTFTVKPKNAAAGPKSYEVRFTGRCDYDRPYGNFFVTKDSSPWECLEPGDHLVLNLGGSCVVSQITPMADEASH